MGANLPQSNVCVSVAIVVIIKQVIEIRQKAILMIVISNTHIDTCMLAYLIPFSARHFVCTLAWPFQQWNQLEFRLIEIKFKVAFDRKTFCYFYPVQNLCHATPTGRALSHKCVSYKNKRNWGNWDFGQHMGMPQCVFMLWRLFNASQTQQQQQCPQMTGLSEQCGRGRGQGCPG